MSNVSIDLVRNSSSCSYVSVGYGSVAASNLVLKYHAARLDQYLNDGLSFAVASARADSDVFVSFGNGWESVDEDGIPI